jgi:hypothetical protein
MIWVQRHALLRVCNLVWQVHLLRVASNHVAKLVGSTVDADDMLYADPLQVRRQRDQAGILGLRFFFYLLARTKLRYSDGSNDRVEESAAALIATICWSAMSAPLLQASRALAEDVQQLTLKIRARRTSQSGSAVAVYINRNN